MGKNDWDFEGRITEVVERGSDFAVKYKEEGMKSEFAFTLPKGELRGAFSEAAVGKKVAVQIDGSMAVAKVKVGWTTVLDRQKPST